PLQRFSCFRKNSITPVTPNGFPFGKTAGMDGMSVKSRTTAFCARPAIRIGTASSEHSLPFGRRLDNSRTAAGEAEQNRAITGAIPAWLAEFVPRPTRQIYADGFSTKR